MHFAELLTFLSIELYNGSYHPILFKFYKSVLIDGTQKVHNAKLGVLELFLLSVQKNNCLPGHFPNSIRLLNDTLCCLISHHSHTVIFQNQDYFLLFFYIAETQF